MYNAGPLMFITYVDYKNNRGNVRHKRDDTYGRTGSSNENRRMFDSVLQKR